VQPIPWNWRIETGWIGCVRPQPIHGVLRRDPRSLSTQGSQTPYAPLSQKTIDLQRNAGPRHGAIHCYLSRQAAAGQCSLAMS
jgi:hypothetical protein